MSYSSNAWSALFCGHARFSHGIDSIFITGCRDPGPRRQRTTEGWKIMIMRFSHRGVLGLLALIAVATPAPAQSDFYKGKSVTIVLSSAAGGGYDVLGRLIAHHLPKHIPGNPTVVVKNMPGAGGIVAANYLFNAAPKDGLTVGGLQNNVPFEPLFGTKEARFDPTKFIWLGTPSRETAILAVSGTTPVDTWQQAKTTEIMLGSSGKNSTPSFYARLMNEVLGLKMKIIVGYQGQTDAFLAMERGEINGYPSVFYNSLMATKPTWLKEGKIKLLVQMGDEKEPEIADVPFLPDLIVKEEDKQLAEAAFAPLSIGRPYLLPPGVPQERADMMLKAFKDTFADPEFIEEGNKRGLGIDAPRDGKALQALIERVYKNTPPAIVERLKKLQEG
jgi:tripartite-type tricarboxylate transporter receptor subunit TctC